jgi:hypothetical protein
MVSADREVMTSFPTMTVSLLGETHLCYGGSFYIITGCRSEPLASHPNCSSTVEIKVERWGILKVQGRWSFEHHLYGDTLFSLCLVIQFVKKENCTLHLL